VVDRLSTDYYSPSVGRIWEEFPRVSDLISFPFGLQRGTLAGLSVAIRPGPSIRIGEAVMEGPFVPQTLPTGTLDLKSIVYTPPDVPQNLQDGFLKTVTLLLPFLGQETLDVNVRLVWNSDPQAGTVRLTLNELSAKGAGELTGSISAEGVRPDLLPPLSRILLSDLNRLSMGQDLSKIALQRLQLNYSDRGLIPATYSYLAEVSTKDAAEVREALTANIFAFTREQLGQVFDDSGPLLETIRAFLEAPGTFSASAAPDPPFSHEVFETLPAGDPGALRNALNITVSANGAEPTPVRFREAAGEEE
jgi:hypothetical protein